MNSQIPPVVAVPETPTVNHLTAALETGAPSQTPPSIPTRTLAAKPSLKRKRALWFDEIEKILDGELEDYKAAWEKLKALFDRPILNSMKTLAPSSLKHYGEALRLFNLTESATNPFKEIKNMPIPQYLQDSINRIFAVTNAFQSNNEAFSRTVLDQILISSLYEEGKGSIRPLEQVHDPKEISHGHPAMRIQEEQEDPAKLELLHEMPLSKYVTDYGETKLLSGFADYSIWYDSAAKNTMATNLLIIEAKRWGCTDLALSQLVAYMGIVHTTRKEESKENSVVYGIASDGSLFRFCRIDNGGIFTKSFIMEWGERPDQIFSIIRSIIRAAALSSPSTTPIKDPQQRRIVLASFHTPDHSERFNHALEELGSVFFYEGDEGTEDAEFISLV